MNVTDNVYNILMRKSLGVCAAEDKGKLNFTLGLSLTWGVGIDESVWRRILGWTARVRFPVTDFSLLHTIQTGSGTYLAFCTMNS
jgi:hypothetical protein